MKTALIFCPFLFAVATVPVVAQEPLIVKDGRTWVWSDALRMYRPEGIGWHWDVDREVFWRAKQSEKTQPSTPRWQPPGEGWQWDAETGHWWRYAPMPPMMIPMGRSMVMGSNGGGC